VAAARPQRIDPRTVQGAAARPVPPKAKAKARAAGASGRPGAVAPRRATLLDWIGAARIPTLPLSVAPVILGVGVAHLAASEADGPGWHWLRALACLAVAVFLQIGVNFANDYSDGVRGTDAVRSGPRRLTASGAASPRAVLTVALVCFALAAAAGLVITVRTGHWWFIAVGAVAILAAWFYTGGRRPYGYAGLGEVAVFVFFGLVATVGTTFALIGDVPQEAWIVAVAAGAFASAVLGVANLRDREQDAHVGKRTLAVRIGDRASRVLTVVLLAIPYGVLGLISAVYSSAAFGFFTLLLTIPAAVITLTAKTARELVLVLRLISLASLLYAVAAAWAIGF